MQKTDAFRTVAKAMATIDFCMMQTLASHGISSRPMSNNGDVEYDGDTWFFARASSRKIAELAQDDRVQLTFTDPQGPSFIAVWGSGEVVDDAALKR